MLREVVSRTDLTIWPEMAMMVFLAVFVFVVFRVIGQSDAEILRHMSRLPLDDELSEPAPIKGERA